jgi:putative membrane protein
MNGKTDSTANAQGNDSATGAHDLNRDTANNDMTASDSQSTAQLREGNDKTTISVQTTREERGFLQAASSAGMYEVQAGEKALVKSSDQRIKSIAQHMVDDHAKANDQLAALAKRKGVEVSSIPTADQLKMLARLDDLNGSDFDREYISQQKSAHQGAIDKFQTAANTATDRDIRDWAAQTLPTLREHLQMINNDADTGIGSER